LEIVGNTYFQESDLRGGCLCNPHRFLARRGRYSEAFRKKDEENIETCINPMDSGM